MGAIVRVPVGQLAEGQAFLEGNGRTWVRVGWESVSYHPGSTPPFLLKAMGLIPVCDMGGNVRFSPDSIVVTGLEGEEVDDPISLKLWQYAVN